MNIFVLHKDPKIAARMHCDKHVVKMILESAQMMCSVMHGMGHIPPYKMTHANHPCTLWVSRSGQNYQWLYRLMEALNLEYRIRFRNIDHLSWTKIVEFHRGLDRNLSVNDFPEKGLTEFAQSMPEKYRDPDPVKAYRAYYLGEKKHLLTYTKREAPKWVK